MDTVFFTEMRGGFFTEMRGVFFHRDTRRHYIDLYESQ